VTRRAVFLDRDGVLNEARVRDGHPYPPLDHHDVTLIAGAVNACRDLAAAGWFLAVVTNQPDIARGTRTRDDVDAINAVIAAATGVSEFVMCPHDDTDHCACRKPRPGMLLETAARHDLDLSVSVMIGDRWRDIDAGAAAGVRTLFVDHGYDEALRVAPDAVVTSLAEAAALLLQEAPRADRDASSYRERAE
jgi:D-glycero-D-manno-heptose 1,7-bisphosphate phosphatase